MTPRADSSGDTDTGMGFLPAPDPSPDVQGLYDADLDGYGYVMNLTRLWAHQPAVKRGLFDLLDKVVDGGQLTMRQRSILVVACASTLGDAYCSLAWGKRLAGEVGGEGAAAVVRGDDGWLDPAERALARWARQVVRDPNATTDGDVQALRDAGYDDAQIFAVTTFVALRLAFSTVNDALGSRPDSELGQRVPEPLRHAVSFGRPVDGDRRGGRVSPARPR